MVRDLRGVVERDKPPFGVLMTLREPTSPMVKEAAAAGFLETAFGKFPRLQILTIRDLLDDKYPKLPSAGSRRRLQAGTQRDRRQTGQADLTGESQFGQAALLGFASLLLFQSFYGSRFARVLKARHSLVHVLGRRVDPKGYE